MASASDTTRLTISPVVDLSLRGIGLEDLDEPTSDLRQEIVERGRLGRVEQTLQFLEALDRCLGLGPCDLFE